MTESPNTVRPECELCSDNKGPFHLHARCHFTAPLRASIENGILTLSCYIPECSRVVASFRVEELSQ